MGKCQQNVKDLLSVSSSTSSGPFASKNEFPKPNRSLSVLPRTPCTCYCLLSVRRAPRGYTHSPGFAGPASCLIAAGASKTLSMGSSIAKPRRSASERLLANNGRPTSPMGSRKGEYRPSPWEGGSIEAKPAQPTEKGDQISECKPAYLA